MEIKVCISLQVLYLQYFSNNEITHTPSLPPPHTQGFTDRHKLTRFSNISKLLAAFSKLLQLLSNSYPACGRHCPETSQVFHQNYSYNPFVHVKFFYSTASTPPRHFSSTLAISFLYKFSLLLCQHISKLYPVLHQHSSNTLSIFN